MLKKKWKYLRDQFATELGKLPPARSGDGAEDFQLPKWQYFKSLLFLKDITAPRTTTGPLKSLLVSNSASADSPQSVIEEESQVSLLDESSNTITLSETELDTQAGGDRTVTPQPTIKEPGRMKRKRDTIDDYQRSVLQIEERKLDCLINKSKERKSDDEDVNLLFLKFLLPHINMIPQQHMLRFRMRLETLVEEFAYPQSTSGGSDYTRSTNSSYQTYSDIPHYRSSEYQTSSQSSDTIHHYTYSNI